MPPFVVTILIIRNVSTFLLQFRDATFYRVAREGHVFNIRDGFTAWVMGAKTIYTDVDDDS